MKKEILRAVSFFALPILLINFVSALGLSDYLSSIEPRTINTFVAFVIVFAVVFFVLNRTFKENKGVPIAIAAVIALFTAYYINQLNFFNWSSSSYGYTDPITKIFYAVIIIFLLEVIAGFVKSKSATKENSKIDWQYLVIGDILAMGLGAGAVWVWTNSYNYGIGTEELVSAVMGIISLAIIAFYNPKKED